MPKKNTTPSKSTQSKAKPRSKKTVAKPSTRKVTKTTRRKTTKKVAAVPLVVTPSILPVETQIAPATVLTTPREHAHPLHPEARLLLIGEYYLVIVLCAIIGIGCMYAILAWV